MLASFKIPLGTCEAELTFTGEQLVEEDFDALLDYVALFKRQYARKAKAGEPFPKEAYVAKDPQAD